MAKVMICRFEALSTCEAERDRLARFGVAVEIRERWNDEREVFPGLTIPRQRGYDACVDEEEYMAKIQPVGFSPRPDEIER